MDYYLRDELGHKFTLPRDKSAAKYSFVRMPANYTANLNLAGKIEFYNPEGQLTASW